CHCSRFGRLGRLGRYDESMEATVYLSPRRPLICEDQSTRQERQVRQVAVPGDWLTLGEVLARLNAAGRSRYSEQQVRRLADAGYFDVDRPPAFGEGAPHRRIRASSVDEYLAVFDLPTAQQQAAMAALRARNTGGPAPVEEPGRGDERD
ncbi:MAG TPA: hypothetical protein VHA75_13930, partial [Rugosimonospora sp.]|nr:hypothetical protein [Rugosimonospora sp.]